MKDIYIVSDVHGNYDGLRDALMHAGLFDNHGQKDANAFIVQIGDLANCIRDSVEDDLRCLDMVGREIDLMLIGNHEMPYFDPQNAFSGFHFDSDISQTLWAHYANGTLLPCYQFENTLILHAGVTEQQLPVGVSADADSVGSFIMRKWEEKRFNNYLFSSCGRARFGRDQIGGMLWCDFGKEFTPAPFPQVVGHTPGPTIRQKGNAICIDTGAKFNGREPTILKLEYER